MPLIVNGTKKGNAFPIECTKGLTYRLTVAFFDKDEGVQLIQFRMD